MPDAHSLTEAATAHLARFDASAAQLERVLRRRVERWAVRMHALLDAGEVAAGVESGFAAIGPIVERLTRSGVLDDGRHAARRAALDVRAGRSARSSRARLAAAGIDAELVDGATERDAETELDAAVAHARKRRLGPFRRQANDLQSRRRALASFARAGYAPAVAVRVLEMGIEEAEAALGRLRARE